MATRRIIYYMVVIFAMSILLAMSNLSNAEEKGKWSIQLEPMWMDVKGNDLHVGDIFKYREDWSYNFVTDTYTEKYGISYNPINLDMKDGFTLRTEIAYRKNQWGLGLSGWWFNTDASARGRVTTPEETWTETPTEIYGTYYKNGVRMWDQTIRPLWNDLEPSGLSPVDYWAKNKLGIWTIDLNGIRTLAEKKDSHIDFAFGLKLGSPDNKREEGQKQRAFIYDYLDPGYHWDNLVTLQSTSKADYSLMGGPVIGLQGKAKIYKGLGVEGLLNQSLLIGRVKQSGTWTDIDDVWVVTGPVGGPFTRVGQYEYLEGKFPFSKKETVALPVTELKLKFLYDFTKNISAGIGGFASIWWNAPVAPQWSVPGDWTAGEGTGWRLQKETLIFYGGMAALNIKF